MWTVAQPCGPDPDAAPAAKGWRARPVEEAPAVTRGGARAWLIETEAPLRAVDWALLSPCERARAAGFATPQLAHRYAGAHVALRRILGAELGLAPERLEFICNPWGRPILPGAGLDFNLSHSGGFALLAVSRCGAVGADIERTTDRPPYEITPQVLSPIEQSFLDQRPASERPGAFYRLWTRKEAVAKALGRGLDTDVVSLDVGVPAAPPRRMRWHFPPLPRIPDFATALAFSIPPEVLDAWVYLVP